MNFLAGVTVDFDRLLDTDVFAWAVNRVLDERELELAPAEAQVTALFDPAMLDRLWVELSGFERCLLLSSLPPAHWAPLVDQLAAQWAEGSSREVGDLAAALVPVAPDRALALFAESLAKRARDTDPDLLFAIGMGLCELAPARGAALVGPYLNAVETAGLSRELEAPAALAVLHGRSEARHLMTRLTRDANDAALASFYALVSRDGMYDAVVHHRARPRLVDAAAAFVAGAPLEAVDAALAGRRRQELPAGQPVGAARALPYLAPEAKTDLHLAAVLDGHLRRDVDAGAMSAAEVLALLAVDLPRLPYRAGLVERLRGLPATEVRAAFALRGNTLHRSYAGQHLAWAAGQLADPELIGFLVALWAPDALPAAGEEAMDSLARIGAAAVPALIAQLAAGLPDATRAWAAGALALIGTAPAVDALARLLEAEGGAAPGWATWLPRRPDARLARILDAARPPFDDAGWLARSQVHAVLGLPEPDPGDEVPPPPAPAPTPVRREQAGRNDPCPCGSGKKYKKCCLAKA